MKRLFLNLLFVVIVFNNVQAQDKLMLYDSVTYNIEEQLYMKKHDIVNQTEEQLREKQKIEKWNTNWAKLHCYVELNKKISKLTKVVFIGISIPDKWRNLMDSAFFENNGIVCRGIDEQTSSEMLVRFQADVISLKPNIVVISAGTNDIAQNNGIIELENIVHNIISMCELAKYHNINPILASVLPVFQFNWHMELAPAEDIIKFNFMIKTYADQNGIPYVDFHSAMKDEKNRILTKYSNDGCHPNKEGYEIMKRIVLKTIRIYIKK